MRRKLYLCFCSMALQNPLAHPDVDFGIDLDKFPNEQDTDWESIALEELTEEQRTRWGLAKQLDKDDTTPLYNMTIGSYRQNQGKLNLTHAMQHEIFENDGEYGSLEEVFAAMKEMPKKLRLYRYVVPPGVPPGYDEEKFGGPWCQNGAQIIAMKVPSLNRTNKNP